MGLVEKLINSFSLISIEVGYHRTTTKIMEINSHISLRSCDRIQPRRPVSSKRNAHARQIARTGELSCSSLLFDLILFSFKLEILLNLSFLLLRFGTIKHKPDSCIPALICPMALAIGSHRCQRVQRSLWRFCGFPTTAQISWITRSVYPERESTNAVFSGFLVQWNANV